MLVLLKSLGVVRAAVVALFLHPYDNSYLYSAFKVSKILNVATNDDGDASISVGISAPRLFRALANDAAGEYLCSIV